jgi:hypothetical protein
VAKYRGLYDVSRTFDENDVILEPVEGGEDVTGVPSSEPTSFYMYTRFIEDFTYIFLSLSSKSRCLGSLMLLPLNLALIVGLLLKPLN